MSYTPSTDFLALLRQSSSGVALTRAPGLDIVVDALARASLFTLYIGQTAPTVNQATTAWLQPAQPSWTAEATLWLWNGTAYVAATPALWSALLAPNSVTPVATSTLVFETIAEARAATISAPQVSFLVIRYAAGYEAATATYTPGASGGPNAFQDAGGRWWQLDLTPTTHYASWYGVKGDGGDYHTQLQSAVSFAAGTRVKLPAGTVGLTQPINATTTVEGAAALRLEGASGAGLTIIDNRCTGGAAACIQAHGAPSAFAFHGFVRGIKFITSTSSAVPFLDIYAEYRFTTEDCIFFGGVNQVTITGSLGDADASNIVMFKRCSFGPCTGAGLFSNFTATVTQTTFVRLEDCFFNSCGLVGWYCIGAISMMHNCGFTENGSGSGGQGALWVVNNGGSNDLFTAINCSFENNYVASVRLDALQGGEFIGCEIAGGSAGIVATLGFSVNGSAKIRFEGTRVRIGSTLTPFTAWNFANGSADNIISNTEWQTWNDATQTRFVQDGTSYGNRFDDSTSTVQEGADSGVMSIACATGANEDVAVPETGTIFAIGGTVTGAFSIGGLTGGMPGRVLILYNGTGFTMTLNNQDAGSLAVHRIQNGSGGNINVLSGQSRKLTYYSPIGNWLAV